MHSVLSFLLGIAYMIVCMRRLVIASGIGAGTDLCLKSGIGACTNSCHFDWGMILGCFWKALWGLVGASWGRLGPLGGLLGASWGPLGDLLGASWRPLGGLLGASWAGSQDEAIRWPRQRPTAPLKIQL